MVGMDMCDLPSPLDWKFKAPKQILFLDELLPVAPAPGIWTVQSDIRSCDVPAIVQAGLGM
eukprot:4941759-Karenia_brevis.AAC.1